MSAPGDLKYSTIYPVSIQILPITTWKGANHLLTNKTFRIDEFLDITWAQDMTGQGELESLVESTHYFACHHKHLPLCRRVYWPTRCSRAVPQFDHQHEVSSTCEWTGQTIYHELSNTMRLSGQDQYSNSNDIVGNWFGHGDTASVVRSIIRTRNIFWNNFIQKEILIEFLGERRTSVQSG